MFQLGILKQKFILLQQKFHSTHWLGAWLGSTAGCTRWRKYSPPGTPLNWLNYPSLVAEQKDLQIKYFLRNFRSTAFCASEVWEIVCFIFTVELLWVIEGLSSTLFITCHWFLPQNTVIQLQPSQLTKNPVICDMMLLNLVKTLPLFQRKAEE